MLLRLFDIFGLSIPILVVSTLLVRKTMSIRSVQKRYGIEMVVFRGILGVAYLLFLDGAFFLLADVSETLGFNTMEEVFESAWHVLALGVLVVVTVSFYGYHRILTQSPDGTYFTLRQS